VIVTAGILASAGYSQPLVDVAGFRGLNLGGPHLYGVSAFGGYTSSYLPGGQPQFFTPGSNPLGADATYGFSGTVGWQVHRQRWNFSSTYSSTYSGMARYSEGNGVSQSLGLEFSRMLRPKWTFSLSMTGADTTLAQMLYQPMMAGLITQLPITMDDLAAAVSLGQFSSAEVASMLTGAPLLESPARNLLLGNRILSYSAHAGLTYVHSPRLSFHFATLAAGGQHRVPNGSALDQPNYLMPRTLGANAGMGLAYMLTPRTQFGLDISSNRTTNRYQSGYSNQADVSLGRKMGPHWFLKANVGGSVAEITNQAYGTPRTKNLIGGGSLGFRTFAHSWVGSYQRTSTDSYGFAIGTSNALSLGWNWHRPGASWSLFTNVGQHQIRNTGYGSITGWQTTAGLTRALSFHTNMSVQYVYFSDAGNYLGRASDMAIHSLRVTWSWAPQNVAH
jgi:hypothetical protein